MRLSDRDIERYLAEGKIGITPAPDADMITADADNAPELFFTPAGGSGDGLPPALSCRRQDLGWRPFPGRAP